MEWSGKGSSSISLPEVWLKVSESMNEWINKGMNEYFSKQFCILFKWMNMSLYYKIKAGALECLCIAF